MPWTPSGTWKQNLRGALVDAYTPIAMNMLISDYFAPKSFTNMAVGVFAPPYEHMVFQLIEEARMEDWLIDLVAAAQERRPKNQALRELAEELGLTLTGPRTDNPTGMPFQAIINKDAKQINLAEFVDRLSILQGQVCWIDIPDGGGTGFLVGPDLVLTNEHVINPLREGAVSSADVKCLFDYKEAIDGTRLGRKKTTEVALYTDKWLEDWRPTSKYDWDPTKGDASKEEMDFALIRLAKEVGELPVGPNATDPEASRRGWIDAVKEPPAVTAGNQVFLLQHPEGEPLQLAVGEVTGYNGNSTRLRYNANSKHGSSGSPCFNADLQLVALHHAYDTVNRPPHWNQAIPFSMIHGRWENSEEITLESPE